MTALRPIVISVKRNAWRNKDSERDERADAEFNQVRQTVLERDGHRCQFCGWTAGKWQEVHHVDDDHTHNSEKNLVTACRWCHAAHHIGLWGLQGLGALAIHPDFPKVTLPDQARLNHLFRAMVVAERVLSGEQMAAASRMIYEADFFFLGECVDAADYWLGSADPSVLAQTLLEMSEKEYADRNKWLSPIRLIPVLNEDELRRNDSEKPVRKEMSVRAYWAHEYRKRYGADWSKFFTGRAA